MKLGRQQKMCGDSNIVTAKYNSVVLIEPGIGEKSILNAMENQRSENAEKTAEIDDMTQNTHITFIRHRGTEATTDSKKKEHFGIIIRFISLVSLS